MDSLSTASRTICPETGGPREQQNAQVPTPAKYKVDFLARTREARGARTQDEVARGLQISVNRYSKYESRTMLPLHLLEPFCIVTQQDVYWLLTGKKRPAIVVERQATTARQRA